MRARQNNLMALHISLIFNTIDEAKKMARYIADCSIAIGKKLNIPFKILIGISENNCRYGKIVSNKNGKRGRPRRVFKLGKKYNVTPPYYILSPHLHVVFYANGATRLGLELCRRINKNFKRTIVKISKCYSNGYISYTFDQSISIRTASYDIDNILEFDFKEEYKHIQSERNRMFKTKCC